MQIFNTYSLGLAAWRRRECEGDNRRWQRGAPEPCLVQLCPSAPPLAPHPADRGQRLSSLLQLTNHVRGEITSATQSFPLSQSLMLLSGDLAEVSPHPDLSPDSAGGRGPPGIVLLTGVCLKIKLHFVLSQSVWMAALLLIKHGSTESRPEMRKILKGSLSYDSSQRIKPRAYFRTRGLPVWRQTLKTFLSDCAGPGSLCSSHSTL